MNMNTNSHINKLYKNRTQTLSQNHFIQDINGIQDSYYKSLKRKSESTSHMVLNNNNSNNNNNNTINISQLNNNN